LDEPTNHLDMASKEVLKKAISEFDGTAIIVSHDRDFLNGLVSKVYEFGGGKVTEHLGGIYDFLSKKKLENLQELEIASSMPASESEPASLESDNKRSYQEQKDLNRKIRKLEKEIGEAENDISRMESQLSSMEQQLATPEGASDTALLQSYLDLKQKIERKMNSWEQLTLDIEKYRKE
ncbi:MAG TPA: glycosyl transferase family 2, partial [Porphyromonadaceae bacterium]|nr:glycosyl transferase family 2 [Porphyromonadaceae bacterium]